MKSLMKKFTVLLLVITLLLTGCGVQAPNDSNQAKNSKEPLDDYWKELSQHMDINDVLVGDLTEEEMDELMKQAEEKLEKGHWQATAINLLLEQGNHRKTVMRSVKLANEYGLDYSLPSPNTGRLLGELFVDDVAFLMDQEPESEKKLRAMPYEERKDLPYRNYYDMVEYENSPDFFGLYLLMYDRAPYFFQSGGVALEEDVYFYTAPELIYINSFGEYTVPGVAVFKWYHDPAPWIADEAKDKAGDGNFYKYYVWFVAEYNPQNFELYSSTLLLEPNEYPVTNLGPDWTPPMNEVDVTAAFKNNSAGNTQ